MTVKLRCGDFLQSPIRQLLNLFPEDEKHVMGILDDLHIRVRELPGYTPLSHTFVLYLIAMQYNQRGMNILEVGTHRGKMAYLLATAASEASVTSLEIDKKNWLFAKGIHETGMIYSEPKVAPVDTILLLCDSAEYLASYNGPQFDMIFIDGDHGDGVLIDVGWWNHLNVGGCILFHDYICLYPKVEEAVGRIEILLDRAPDIKFLPDGGLVGFYKEPGDGKL